MHFSLFLFSNSSFLLRFCCQAVLFSHACRCPLFFSLQFLSEPQVMNIIPLQLTETLRTWIATMLQNDDKQVNGVDMLQKRLFPSTKSLGLSPRFDLPPGLPIYDLQNILKMALLDYNIVRLNGRFVACIVVVCVYLCCFGYIRDNKVDAT